MKTPDLKALFSFRNQAQTTGPIELMIYEDIGKDPWTGEGLSAKDCVDKLASMDNTRELHVHVNSRGGLVFEGLPVYNKILSWGGQTIGFNDGVAASIASVILMGCKEVRTAAASQMLIHDAWAEFIVEGNADDIRKKSEETCARLETVSDMIAGIYSRKTGMSKEQCREIMKENKLMNGEQCVALKFADSITEGTPLYNFSPDDLHAIRALAGGVKPGGKPPTTKGSEMDKSKILALLNKLGMTVDEKATEEQLLELLAKSIKPETKPAAQSSEIVELKNALTALTNQRNAERLDRITRAVDQAIIDDKITTDQREKWVAMATKDEAALDMLAALESKPHGVKTHRVIETNAAPDTILKAMAANMVRGQVDTAAERGLSNSRIFAENREKLLQFMNAGTNTISSDLKFGVAIQESISAFSKRLLPLRMFSTVFDNVPVGGAATASVPYFPLRADASTDWNSANGYVMGGTAEVGAKKITLDKRKYQPLDYPSDTLARQPFFDVVKLLQMNAEKLAYDVFADVLSLVTLATFGAAPVTIDPAVATSDEIIDVKTACDNANWPLVGRGLITNAALDNGLMKDSAFKNAMAFGGSEVMRTGQLPSFLGFEYGTTPNLPSNGEKLIGVAFFKSAILAAFAPVAPAPGVRGSLIDYSIVTDAQTGLSFNFRHWGDADMDTDRMAIECAYGRIAGEATAAKRICQP